MLARSILPFSGSFNSPLTLSFPVPQLKTIDHHYTPSNGLLTVTFASTRFCNTSNPSEGDHGRPQDDTSDQRQKPKRAGWGFFSTLSFLFFAAIISYFVLGAFFQKTQYGAQGWDLIVSGIQNILCDILLKEVIL